MGVASRVPSTPGWSGRPADGEVGHVGVVFIECAWFRNLVPLRCLYVVEGVGVRAGGGAAETASGAFVAARYVRQCAPVGSEGGAP
jgi:hypothetical protein